MTERLALGLDTSELQNEAADSSQRPDNRYRGCEFLLVSVKGCKDPEHRPAVPLSR